MKIQLFTKRWIKIVENLFENGGFRQSLWKTSLGNAFFKGMMIKIRFIR